MVICRTFPSEVHTLPSYFLYLGIPHPYKKSGIASVISFITNMGYETLTSRFLIFYVYLLQLEISSVEDVLSQDFTRWVLLATNS